MDEVIIVEEGSDTIIVEAPNSDSITVSPEETVISISNIGLQGPPGPTGPNSFYHLHTQASPSNLWPVQHDLGAYPNVSVIVDRSEGGLTVGVAHVLHVDVNNLNVSFNMSVSGYAICS